VVADAGMGTVNASIVATILAEHYACRALVLSGVAQGLDPELRVGDIVVADRVIQHDAGLLDQDRVVASHAGHLAAVDPTGTFGYAVGAALMVRLRRRIHGFWLPDLSASAGGAGAPPRIICGTMLTGDRYLHSDSLRSRLHGEFGGRAVDMESGAVARVAESFAIPWLVVRSLSNRVGYDSQFDFLAFATQVAVRSAATLRHLLPII